MAVTFFLLTKALFVSHPLRTWVYRWQDFAQLPTCVFCNFVHVRSLSSSNPLSNNKGSYICCANLSQDKPICVWEPDNNSFVRCCVMSHVEYVQHYSAMTASSCDDFKPCTFFASVTSLSVLVIPVESRPLTEQTTLSNFIVLVFFYILPTGTWQTAAYFLNMTNSLQFPGTLVWVNKVQRFL